jgi:ketosteroid isomerase-like protein
MAEAAPTVVGHLDHGVAACVAMLLLEVKLMSLFSRACIVLLSIGWHAAAWGQTAGEQIIAALEHYRVAVLESNIEDAVASFTEDAQLSEGSEPVVQGRTTIRALLRAQRNIKVVAYDLHAAATRVQGSTAIQNGVYSQRRLSQQQQSTLVRGVFEVQWARQQDGSWLINRLRTEQIE